MNVLHSSSLLARLVLAWFVLTVGAAMASPFIHPQAMERVCTTGGATKLVVLGDDREEATLADLHTLDCPMCLQWAAPVPRAQTPARHSQPLAHALHPLVAATLAAMVGAPLPPRGPPALVS